MFFVHIDEHAPRIEKISPKVWRVVSLACTLFVTRKHCWLLDSLTRGIQLACLRATYTFFVSSRKWTLYTNVDLRYAIFMVRSMNHFVRCLGWLLVTGSFVGCSKDPAPTADPATKEAVSKEAVSDAKSASPLATAAPLATTAAAPPENASAKPLSSSEAAAPPATAGAKTPAPSETTANAAAAPTASTQPAAPVSAAAPAPIVAATSAVPETPPPPPVESPKQTGQAFSVWLQSSGRYTAGQQGTVEAVVVPKGEFHCNPEYPYKFVTSGSSGVTYPKATLRAEGVSVSPSRAVMRVPFVPQSAGDAKVGGTFHFSVCTDQQCVVEKRDVSVIVKVQ